jgi:O-acetylserine/cysteine efflux transporter
MPADIRAGTSTPTSLTWHHTAGLLLVTVVWGANFVAVKAGLAQVPPFLLLALRFAAVAAILLPFLKWPPPGRFGAIVGLAVTFGVLHFSLLFLGMRAIDAATAAIAIQLQVPFGALLAALFFKDRIGWRRLTGMAIAFAGVAVIAGEPRFQGGILPLMLVIGAAAMFAVASVQMKWLGPGIDVFTMYGWLAVLSLPPALALSLWLEEGQLAAVRNPDWRAWASIAYQAALVTVLGHGSWYRLMRRYPINLVMPFTLLVPVFGVLSGVIVLGEELTPSIIVGGLATLVGVAIIVLRRPRAVESSTRGGL